MEKVTAQYTHSITLGKNYTPNKLLPKKIVENPIQVTTWERENGTKIVLATFPEVNDSEVLQCFDGATREKKISDPLTVHRDWDLPERADPTKYLYHDGFRQLLDRHLQSPLIGWAFRQFQQERPLYLEAVDTMLELPPLHQRIKVVDFEKFTKEYFKTALPKPQQRIMFVANFTNFSELLKGIQAPKHMIDEIRQLEKTDDWITYIQRKDILLSTLRSTYGDTELSKKVENWFDSFPLRKRIKLIKSLRGFISLPKDVFVDPKTGRVVNLYECEEDIAKEVILSPSRQDIAIQDVRKTMHIHVGQLNENTGVYDIDSITEEVNPTYGEGGLIPAVAWMERKGERRLLTPEQTRRLAHSPRAMAILGRVVATALSPDMYPTLPLRMPLEKGKNQTTNDIEAVQIGSALLMDRLSRRLAKQEIFREMK